MAAAADWLVVLALAVLELVVAVVTWVASYPPLTEAVVGCLWGEAGLAVLMASVVMMVEEEGKGVGRGL